MRHTSTILLLILACASLAACGGGSSDTSSSMERKVAELEAREAKERKQEPELSAADAKFAKEHPGSADFGSPPLEFEADPDGSLAYTVDEVTAKEGNVTIEFTNPQDTPHDVAIEALPSGARVATERVTDGFTAVVTELNTKEKFIFYCTVPGHRAAGMKGIVRVKPRP